MVNPRREIIAHPDNENSIVHVAHASGALAFSMKGHSRETSGNIEQRIVFQIKDSHGTFELSDLLHIWRKNKVEEKTPSV
jgi:hypothetical protein